MKKKLQKFLKQYFNDNDELYSQSKVIEMSQGCDGILTSLTEKWIKKQLINYLIV